MKLTGFRLGRRVAVVAGSSAAEYLEALNQALHAKDMEDVRIREAEPYMEIGDLLGLVDTGAWSYAVTDLHLARLWAGTLRNLRVREDLVVHEGASLAWAVRKDSPELLRQLSAFSRTVRTGTALGNVLQRRYFTPGERLTPSAQGADLSRFRFLEPHFKRVAENLGIDWLRLAAVAYQESRFRQHLVSPAGAVGVMQVLPSTATSPSVNVTEYRTDYGNIRAGGRYLVHLRDEVFNDPGLSRQARMNFAIAAYNAGPTRIQELRRDARANNLDPDRWFGNVEYLAGKAIGRETVDYVLGVNKYYAILAGLADYMTRQEAAEEF